MKPQSKAESKWRLEYDELKYVCHTVSWKRFVKRALARASRRLQKELYRGSHEA